MDAARLTALVSSPPVVFSLAVGLFLVLVRSPWPWTRAGGSFLAAVVAAALAFAFRDPELRRSALDSERLPILILLAASAAATWVAFRQTSRKSDAEEAAPWHGFAPGELLAGGFAVLGVALGAFFLEAPLVPMDAPALSGDPGDLAAPWFLLGLRELLRYFDPWVAIGFLPLLSVLGLLALPYLDVPSRGARVDFEERRDVVYFFLFVWFLLALAPMVSAVFLPRVPNELPLRLARPFSEFLWGLLAGAEPPRRAWARELPPFAILAGYFFFLPRGLPRWRPTRALFGRYLKRLGPRRFYLAMAFMQLWMLVPAKMYGRWLFGIGYFVYLPEIDFTF